MDTLDDSIDDTVLPTVLPGGVNPWDQESEDNERHIREDVTTPIALLLDNILKIVKLSVSETKCNRDHIGLGVFLHDANEYTHSTLHSGCMV